MSGAMPSHSPMCNSLAFLGLLLTIFSLKGCERKKIWMNPGGKKKSVPSNDIYKPPFADNFAGFSGIFPGSPPDLIGPASSLFLIPFPQIDLLRRQVSSCFLKKEAKNKKLLGTLDEIRRRPWLRQFLLA